jgi:hypothetical protein
LDQHHEQEKIIHPWWRQFKDYKMILSLLALPVLFALPTDFEGPCDILGAAGNPCVAAHSTVRALYAAYSGALYKVSRKDGRSINVNVKEGGGGFANITDQDQVRCCGAASSSSSCSHAVNH